MHYIAFCRILKDDFPCKKAIMNTLIVYVFPRFNRFTEKRKEDLYEYETSALIFYGLMPVNATEHLLSKGGEARTIP